MRKNNYKTKTQVESRKRLKGKPWVDGGYLRLPTGHYVHQLTYKQTYGDYPPGWTIHHINRDTLDNNPTNLIALPTNIRGTILQLPKSHHLPRQTLNHWIEAYLKEGKRLDRKYLKKYLKKQEEKNILKEAKKDWNSYRMRRRYFQTHPLGYIKPKIEPTKIDETISVTRYDSRGKRIK